MNAPDLRHDRHPHFPMDPHQNPRPELRVELVSKTVYLCAVRDMMRQVCKRLGFHDDQTSQIVLAVDEALANVMKHGYEGREDGRIWLEVFPFASGPRGPGVRIVITDHARQVDPASMKGRDLDEVRPGGLGVHIIRQVMDEAIYTVGQEAGMRLTLIKHLSSPAVRGPGPTQTGGPSHG